MAKVGSADIRVSVPVDGSVAELCIPEGFDPATVSIELVLALLQQAGVVIDDGVRHTVQESLQSITPGVACRLVVATMFRPVHGEDGWIEWLVPELAADASSEVDGEQAETAESDGDETGGASHYDRSAFVIVEAGTPVARIHPPTLGEDGRDVRGRVLAAKQGKPAPLKIDDSLSINSSGVVAAEMSGAVLRSGQTLSIRSLLDIKDSVDFSTGNISFEGSVRVRREIKDLFVVECRGSIEVGGLIQAATLRCDGDLIARGGMAGRERGSITCAGSIQGRYFDAARIEVRGNLSFERELINCDTTVHGCIVSPRGSIIGGNLQVAGGIVVANIGSRGGASTRIILGLVPELARRHSVIEQLLRELDSRAAVGAVELRRLSEPGKKLGSEQIERKTELSFYEQSAAKQRQRLIDARERVAERLAELSVVDVRVERMLNHGARFVMNDLECRITRETRGPLRITRARDGSLVFRAGANGSLRPLADLGETRLVDRPGG